MGLIIKNCVCVFKHTLSFFNHEYCQHCMLPESKIFCCCSGIGFWVG
jgi:hypothetical protein